MYLPMKWITACSSCLWWSIRLTVWLGEDLPSVMSWSVRLEPVQSCWELCREAWNKTDRPWTHTQLFNHKTPSQRTLFFPRQTQQLVRINIRGVQVLHFFFQPVVSPPPVGHFLFCTHTVLSNDCPYISLNMRYTQFTADKCDVLV